MAGVQVASTEAAECVEDSGRQAGSGISDRA